MLLESTTEVFALLLLVSVVAIVLVMRALRRATAGSSRNGSPKRIHLRRADGALKDPAGMEGLARPLLDRGFTDAGTWVIEPLGLAVRFLNGPEEGLYAAVYDRHPKAGMWVDLVTLHEDGSSITVNNLARASALDERPGHRKMRLGGARSDEVLDRMRQERARERKAPLRLSDADLPLRFERAYADEMDWRDARGGPTDAEIRRIAAASGKTLTDEQVRAAKEILSEQAKSRRER